MVLKLEDKVIDIVVTLNIKYLIFTEDVLPTCHLL